MERKTLVESIFAEKVVAGAYLVVMLAKAFWMLATVPDGEAVAGHFVGFGLYAAIAGAWLVFRRRWVALVFFALIFVPSLLTFLNGVVIPFALMGQKLLFLVVGGYFTFGAGRVLHLTIMKLYK
jgi:hypothetical protein